ncbi:MAG: hypothetical protein L0212_11060 [Acidobacteria bacterium]|nr:hypothetical protein [Acidobacteriota bacterium]
MATGRIESSSMMLLYIFLGVMGVALLYYVVKLILAARRFKRHFEEFSEEAAQRLLSHADQVDSTLERWHEYDEAYQEAVAKLEEEGGGQPYEPGRGASLGPSGGSFRKPN